MKVEIPQVADQKSVPQGIEIHHRADLIQYREQFQADH